MTHKWPPTRFTSKTTGTRAYAYARREALLWGSLASCGRLSIGPPAAQSASLRESHARFKLTPEHRAAWLLRMKDACSDTGSEDLALFDFFRQASKYLALAEHPDLHQLARSPRCGVLALMIRRDRPQRAQRRTSHSPLRPQPVPPLCEPSRVPEPT